MSTEIREKINKFIDELKNSYGNLPKFCHNLNAPANKVYYAGAYFDNNELSAAIETLLFGKWSSAGEVCHKFEKEFAKVVNQKFGVFCNSGSSANLIMIAALKEYYGWKDGDEIIVSPVGFPTTITSIIQNNLKPVFVDIEFDTLNFNIDQIAELLRKYDDNTEIDNPKAIFISPVLGNPPDMERLDKLAKAYGVQLILDCCDSLKSEYQNKQLPEWCVASSFSFYPAHEITTLEGGMVTSNIKEIVEIARSYMTWGRACYCVGTANLLANGSCGCRFKPWLEGYAEPIDHKYVFDRIGYNLKPLDLQAAIGLEQLKKLIYFCDKRIGNRGSIQHRFKDIPGISFPKDLPESLWVPFATPIICETKELKYKLVDYLEKNGIQTRNYFAGNILLHKPFRYLDNYKNYPNANQVLEKVFFVGCAPTISDENIKHIEEVLKNYKNE